MKLKTFRGRLADNGVERIRLSTNNGLTGYKINKFEIISQNPGSANAELLCQLFTTENDETGQPRTASGTIDFTDPTLIGVAFYADRTTNEGSDSNIIFDTMKFNQDIFVTTVDVAGTTDTNYYLELEQVALSKDEATVATLKDMRAGPDTNFGS